MTKPQKRRDLETQMRAHGCAPRSGAKGIHDKWDCPCGRHSANVPRHRDVSPGVVKDIIKRLECLPEGWSE